MYASDQCFLGYRGFRTESHPSVVPAWFRRFAAPLLLLLALPLSLMVLALVLGLAAARGILRLLAPAPVVKRSPPTDRPRAAAGEILTDVDYIVLDEKPRNR